MKRLFQLFNRLAVITLIISTLVMHSSIITSETQTSFQVKAWLEVKGTTIDRQYRGDGELVRVDKREFYYHTKLVGSTLPNLLDKLSSDPDSLKLYSDANWTKVLGCSNEKKLSAGKGKEVIPVTLRLHQEEQEPIDGKMVTTYLYDGNGQTPDDVVVMISAIPKQNSSGYFYRLLVSTFAILPKGPKPVVKKWDSFKEALVVVPHEYGIRAPNNSVLAELQFKYSDDKVGFLDIPDTEELENYLRNPAGPKKINLEGFQHKKGDGRDYETRVTVKLTINPKPPVEAVIYTDQNYEDWIPTVDLKGQNRLKVRVKLEKEDGSVPEETAQFKFELVQTSRQKGVCTNYPLDGNEDYDLTIEQGDNPNLTVLNEAGLSEVNGVTVPTGQAAQTEAGLKEAEVIIRSLDYGAFGALKVYAYLDTGEMIEAHVKKVPEQTALAIPKDDNSNCIADRWEKEMKVFDKFYAATWDEDSLPTGQRRNGDGYTLYEEYRGFKTIAKEHERTNPDEKDLFIYDQNGLVAKHYLTYKPAELKLHFIDPTMMVFNNKPDSLENRQVNFNTSPDLLYARQYAMHVMEIPPVLTNEKGELDIGEANNIPGVDIEKAFKEPLKYFYVVRISPEAAVSKVKEINDPKLRAELYQKLLDSTVIHEMGHAMGITHHRINGVEDRAERYSGLINCAMRYPTPDEYNDYTNFPSQTIYCGPDGIGIRIILRQEGDKHYKIGETACFSHNCFAQIDVKSDPSQEVRPFQGGSKGQKPKAGSSK